MDIASAPHRSLTDLSPSRQAFAANRGPMSLPYHSGQSARPDASSTFPPSTAGLAPALPPSDNLQERLQTFLAKNLKERVSLKDLADLLGYSQKYCSEFFRIQMGVCFSHYVKNLRLATATRMLGNHDLSLSHIAEMLGFSDSFAFSHFFKRAVGCSPTEFRKHHTLSIGCR